MAILAPFRSPQPPAPYRYPAYVDNGGVAHGWLPPNSGFGTILYSTRGIQPGAFAGAIPVVPIAGTGARPSLWGMLRGLIAWQQPAIPP